MKQSEQGIDRVMPEHRTRKQHLLAIAYLKKRDPEEAFLYWLKCCPRISRKAFNEA